VSASWLYLPVVVTLTRHSAATDDTRNSTSPSFRSHRPTSGGADTTVSPLLFRLAIRSKRGNGSNDPPEDTWNRPLTRIVKRRTHAGGENASAELGRATLGPLGPFTSHCPPRHARRFRPELNSHPLAGLHLRDSELAPIASSDTVSSGGRP
jgi:hypothetical protein